MGEYPTLWVLFVAIIGGKPYLLPTLAVGLYKGSDLVVSGRGERRETAGSSP
jgi:hypothetical protein